MKILFLTLKAFSATGGIEKICRVAGRAMYEYTITSREEFTMYSLYDAKNIDTQPYLPSHIFKGFAGAKIGFVIRSLREGIKSRVVVLSHINLLLPAYLIKLFSSKTKVVLLANGIETGKPLSLSKKKILQRIDLIISGSDFIKEKIKVLYNIPEEKCCVLNNCLDPFLPPLADKSRRTECRSIYGIAENDFVLMTMSQLSKEKSTGYDKVLIAVKKLHALFPNVKYLFVGKYDDAEKVRLDSVINDLGIEDHVIFTGFVPNGVLADYYNMADLYIIPNEKEGFGFPFIEALYYNKPVIAGKGHSITDNTYGNSLGTLIDLSSQENITTAIQKIITNVKAFMPDRELVMEKFSYPVYKNNWKKILDEI
ncbi:MAG: glycosyltransferase family 4 protein [Ginsengibacter sp.]